MIQIEFFGRGVHVQTPRGVLWLTPAEVFKFVAWAHANEFVLREKARELEQIADRMEEQQRRTFLPLFPENGDE